MGRIHVNSGDQRTHCTQDSATNPYGLSEGCPGTLVLWVVHNPAISIWAGRYGGWLLLSFIASLALCHQPDDRLSRVDRQDPHGRRRVSRSLCSAHALQIVLRFGIVGLDAQGLLELADGVLGPPDTKQCTAEIIVR